MYGFRDDGQRLVFHVSSHGCTEKEDFIVRAEAPTGGGETPIMLIRVRPDNCKRLMREGVEITFARKELGLSAQAPLRVLNPAAGAPGR